MNNHNNHNNHKHRPQKVSKSTDKDEFEKKLEKSLGLLEIDIYRTEFGEVTMQQRFNKSISLNYFCFSFLFSLVIEKIIFFQTTTKIFHFRKTFSRISPK